MKYLLKIHTLLLMILILNACSSDLFTDYGNPFSRDRFVELAIETIGTAGGEIAIDSVRVTIPEGAFSVNQELTIAVNKRDTTLKAYSTGSMYSISGLPDQLAEPLVISIPYSGSLSGDSLVAIGQLGWSTSLDTTRWAFHMVPAELASGLVSFSYPDTGKLADWSGGEIKFRMVNHYSSHASADGHFLLHYPESLFAQGLKLGTYLELIYDSCGQMGFDLDQRSWPLHVTVMDSKSTGYYTQYFNEGVDPTNEALRQAISLGKLSVGEQLLNNDPQLMLMLAHEFMHLVQNLYEFSAPWFEPRQAWLQEALAVWFEHKFSSNRPYVSHYMTGWESAVFAGLQGNEHQHGYGVPYIFNELVDQQGEEVVLSVFESIQSGSLPDLTIDTVDAILTQIEEGVDFFWFELLRDFVIGKYYSGSISLPLLNDPANYLRTLSVSPSFVRQTMAFQYPDLSGNIFRIVISDSEWSAKMKLKIALDPVPACGLVVFKYKAEEEISTVNERYPGEESVLSVGDLQQIRSDGYDLIVLVTNGRHLPDYTGQQALELSVELVIED